MTRRGPDFALYLPQRFLVQYHNNDGGGSFGPQPWWARAYNFNRRAMFLALGEYRPTAHQLIWFSQPRLLADSDGVAAGPQNRVEMGT